MSGISVYVFSFQEKLFLLHSDFFEWVQLQNGNAFKLNSSKDGLFWDQKVEFGSTLVNIWFKKRREFRVCHLLFEW